MVLWPSRDLLQLNTELPVKTSRRLSYDFINSDYSKYSLIITDLVMPKVDGYDLARQVKGARPNIPIWLLTTDRKLSRLKTTKETPFDLILSKPIIDFELLKEKIEKLFSSITQD
jgi:CheY-like chemotaxis protein